MASPLKNSASGNTISGAEPNLEIVKGGGSPSGSGTVTSSDVPKWWSGPAQATETSSVEQTIR